VAEFLDAPERRTYLSDGRKDTTMNPILYLLLITIGGGILAIILAIALLIFIVGFVGWLAMAVRLFSNWKKDSMLQRSATAEWMQRAAGRPAGENSNERSKNKKASRFFPGRLSD
jgi:hypothetical protein